MSAITCRTLLVCVLAIQLVVTFSGVCVFSDKYFVLCDTVGLICWRADTLVPQ